MIKTNSWATLPSIQRVLQSPAMDAQPQPEQPQPQLTVMTTRRSMSPQPAPDAPVSARLAYLLEGVEMQEEANLQQEALSRSRALSVAIHEKLRFHL